VYSLGIKIIKIIKNLIFSKKNIRFLNIICYQFESHCKKLGGVFLSKDAQNNTHTHTHPQTHTDTHTHKPSITHTHDIAVYTSRILSLSLSELTASLRLHVNLAERQVS
jgi:hypothetical protein